MSPNPIPSRAPTTRRRSEIAKVAMAVGVFGAIVGGYVAITRSEAAAIDAARLLPEADRRSDACTLWFVGSSTIFKWRTLAHDMTPWDAHDRGVNGAMIPDIVRWFGHEPRGAAPAGIVWYAGENDIAARTDAATAFAAFRTFMALKTQRYGALPVVALSLKPSPARWANLPQQTAFNDALRRYAARRADLVFLDIRPLMLEGGRPGPYYVDDGIHMNPAGYARWTATLRPALARIMPRPVVARCAVTASPLPR